MTSSFEGTEDVGADKRKNVAHCHLAFRRTSSVDALGMRRRHCFTLKKESPHRKLGWFWAFMASD